MPIFIFSASCSLSGKVMVRLSPQFKNIIKKLAISNPYHPWSKEFIQVAEHLKTVSVEIEHYVRGRGKIGNYLADLFQGFRNLYWIAEDALSTVLWDLATIAYLRNSDWVPSKLVPAPLLGIPDLIWRDIGVKRHLCRMAIDVKRDPIFFDFFKSLEKYGKGDLYE